MHYFARGPIVLLRLHWVLLCAGALPQTIKRPTPVPIIPANDSIIREIDTIRPTTLAVCYYLTANNTTTCSRYDPNTVCFSTFPANRRTSGGLPSLPVYELRVASQSLECIAIETFVRPWLEFPRT